MAPVVMANVSLARSNEHWSSLFFFPTREECVVGNPQSFVTTFLIDEQGRWKPLCFLPAETTSRFEKRFARTRQARPPDLETYFSWQLPKASKMQGAVPEHLRVEISVWIWQLLDEHLVPGIRFSRMGYQNSLHGLQLLKRPASQLPIKSIPFFLEPFWS
jgi:hypothetical protein